MIYLSSYPRLSDIGLNDFIDSLMKFDLKSICLNLGTVETSTTVNISDNVVRKLCKLISKLKVMDSIEVNLKQ